MPTLSQLWRLYLRRFAIDHWNRFAKQRLHWTYAKERAVGAIHELPLRLVLWRKS